MKRPSLWTPRAFCIGDTMISKILSIIKNKFKLTKSEEKASPSPSQKEVYFLDNPCSHFTIEVDEEGDFVIGFGASKTNLESVEAVGNLIFLINTGALATFFVQSIELWVADSEGKEKEKRESFASLIFAQWNETHIEHQEMLAKEEKANSPSAVDPSRVFNLRKYL